MFAVASSFVFGLPLRLVSAVMVINQPLWLSLTAETAAEAEAAAAAEPEAAQAAESTAVVEAPPPEEPPPEEAGAGPLESGGE